MSEFIPQVSLFISGIALLFSIVFGLFNLWTSREALRISKEAAQRAEANSLVTRIDTFRYRIPKKGVSLYIFTLEIRSQSTNPNSLVAAELRIPAVRDGVERTLVYKHSPLLATAPPINLKNALQVPAALLPRSAIVANCCFEVPDESLKDAVFGPFIVRLTYAAGPEAEVRTDLIMDVPDAEHLQKKRQSGIPV